MEQSLEVTWDSIFVPNGLEQFSQVSGSCTEVGLQHFSMNRVYTWGFSTLHSFDGIFDFHFCWGGVWCRCGGHLAGGGVGGFIWLGVVQDFTEVLNPSVGLFTFSYNSAAIFAFHGGRVISIITTETFGDLIDSAQFTSCCSTLLLLALLQRTSCYFWHSFSLPCLCLCRLLGLVVGALMIWYSASSFSVVSISNSFPILPVLTFPCGSSSCGPRLW